MVKFTAGRILELMSTGPTIAPAVSVIMPTRDCAPYVAEAVESILGQTFRDFEFIIIDDGSTDATVEIVSRYANVDERIRLVKRPARGLVAALNEGLKLARTPLIARMDGDDVARADRLNKQYRRMLSAQDLVLLGGQANLVDARGRFKRILRVPVGSDAVAEALTRTCPFIHPSVMFRREVALAVGGYRELFRYAEDYDLWLRLSRVGRLDNLDEPVLRFRQHGDSVSDRNPEHQAIATTLALTTHQAILAGAADPTRSLQHAPQELDALLDLAKGADARLHLAFDYHRALVLTGAIRNPSARRQYFRFLKQLRLLPANARQDTEWAPVLVRSVMQFLRWRQSSAAARTLIWAGTNLPVDFVKAGWSAMQARLFSGR